MANDAEGNDKKERRQPDPDLAAISRITRALSELKPDERARVLAFVNNRENGGGLPPATA